MNIFDQQPIRISMFFLFFFLRFKVFRLVKLLVKCSSECVDWFDL